MKNQKFSVTRGDLIFLTIAGLVVIATRWFYHSRYLFHWDSVQFALALEGLDVLQHRPHPPGYLFYIGLGKIGEAITGDANTAFIALGILASLVVLFLVYYLSVRLFNNRLAGVIAGILFVFNILTAFHGMVAEVYIVEAAAALGVLTLLYNCWEKPTPARLMWAVAALGLLGGIRQATEVALFPVLLYVLIYHRAAFRHWLATAGTLLITNLIWFIPLVLTSDGIGNYIASLKSLSNVVLLRDFAKLGWWGKVADNLRIITQAMSTSMGWELVVGYLGLTPWLIHHETTKKKGNSSITFWLIAAGGPFLLVALTLMTNPGYILLPVILLLIGIAGGLANFYTALTQKLSQTQSALIVSVIMLLLLGHQFHSFFTLKPEDFAFISPSYQSISTHDKLIAALTSGVTDNSVASETAIWVDSPQTMLFFDIRHLQYYLPGYNVYRRAPDSIIHPKDKPIWHANGSKENFIEKVRVGNDVKRLFIIRPFWNELHEQFQIPIQISEDRFIVYYDLTDPESRAHVATRFNFIVE